MKMPSNPLKPPCAAMAVIMMPLQASRFGVISSPLILLAALQEHLQIESFSEN